MAKKKNDNSPEKSIAKDSSNKKIKASSVKPKDIDTSTNNEIKNNNDILIEVLIDKFSKVIDLLEFKEKAIPNDNLENLSFGELSSFKNILSENISKENYHGGNSEFRIKCGLIINKINAEINRRIEKYL